MAAYRRALGAAWLIALYGIAAALVAAAVRRHVPWPMGSGLRIKMEHIRDHGDDLSLVFVGSSRVFRGVDPLLFDSTLASAGIELRSFNLGVNGMAMFEADYVVKRLLEQKPERLRYVVYEWQPWDADFATQDIVWTDRSIEWHDLEQSLLVGQVLWNFPLRRDDGFELGLLHARLFATRASNLGSGESALLHSLGIDPPVLGEQSRRALANGGWESFDSDRGRTFGRGYEFAPAAWREHVADIDRINAHPLPVHRLDLTALRRQIAACERAGVVPIHVAFPSVRGDPLPYALAAAGEFRVFAGFNSPARYPTLFEYQAHYDDDHLNERGARIFTVALARWFAGWLRSTGR